MAEYRQRDYAPAPPELVTAGKFNFGTFSSQFRRVNPLDAHNPLGSCMPRPLLDYRLKEWQAFQLGNSRWFMLAVLYNAKFSALAQFIAYDKESRKKYVFERMLPSWAVRVPDSLWEGKQSYRDRDNCIEIISRLAEGRFDINVCIHDQKGLPDIDAGFELLHNEGLVEPIVVSIPFGANRGVYSHKCLMPMQGSLTIGGEVTRFHSSDSFGIIDDHKGFYPYVMKYDWLTAAGYDSQGVLTGFNLTANQSVDPVRFNENCLWQDGKIRLLPPVKFTRPYGVQGKWLIRDEYGMVDLYFQPESMGKIDLNLLAVRVKYFGPFGYVEGFIRDSSGVKVPFERYFGMGEQKYVRG
jgi:hypothetical protein